CSPRAAGMRGVRGALGDVARSPSRRRHAVAKCRDANSSTDFPTQTDMINASATADRRDTAGDGSRREYRHLERRRAGRAEVDTQATIVVDEIRVHDRNAPWHPPDCGEIDPISSTVVLDFVVFDKDDASLLIDPSKRNPGTVAKCLRI